MFLSRPPQGREGYAANPRLPDSLVRWKAAKFMGGFYGAQLEDSLFLEKPVIPFVIIGHCHMVWMLVLLFSHLLIDCPYFGVCQGFPSIAVGLFHTLLIFDLRRAPLDVGHIGALDHRRLAVG